MKLGKIGKSGGKMRRLGNLGNCARLAHVENVGHVGGMDNVSRNWGSAKAINLGDIANVGQIRGNLDILLQLGGFARCMFFGTGFGNRPAYLPVRRPAPPPAR